MLSCQMHPDHTLCVLATDVSPLVLTIWLNAAVCTFTSCTAGLLTS